MLRLRLNIYKEHFSSPADLRNDEKNISNWNGWMDGWTVGLEEEKKKKGGKPGKSVVRQKDSLTETNHSFENINPSKQPFNFFPTFRFSIEMLLNIPNSWLKTPESLRRETNFFSGRFAYYTHVLHWIFSEYDSHF